jgi:hypothetical protein
MLFYTPGRCIIPCMRFYTHGQCISPRMQFCTNTSLLAIVIRGSVPLAAIIAEHDCGGQLGTCCGLVVGLSGDDSIEVTHTVGLASLPLLHPHCCPHHNWHLPNRHVVVHGAVAIFLSMPVVLLPTQRCVRVTWPLVVQPV